MKIHHCLTIALAAGIGLFVLGCDSKVPKDPLAQSSSQSTKNGAASPAAPAAGTSGSTESYAAANTWETDPDLMLSKVPDSLKTLPCFQYEGFAGRPVMMMMTSTNSPKVLTGQVSIHLKKVTDDSAYFVIARTGTLGQQLGNDLIVLRKDGVFNLTNSQFKLSDETMEMPAAMTAGTKWDAKVTASTDATSITQDLHMTLSGPETVHLPIGTHQAMVIQATGTSTNNGKVFTSSNSVYCVKGMGEMKTVVSQSDGQGHTTVITLQPVTKAALADAYKAAQAIAKSQAGGKK